MAFLTTERLLQQAKDGDKLNTEDRRRVVAYLMSTMPELANTDMAELLQVTEGAIRKDKTTIREEMAKEVRDDDVALVVADIAFNFRRQIRDLENSKSKVKPGCTEYRLHCQAILDLELKKTKAFQELGYLPKNLGNMTMENFEYAAIVVKDGSVESRPLTAFDEKTQREIRARQPKGLPAGPKFIEAEVISEPAQREVSYVPDPSGKLPASIEDTATEQKDESSNSSPSPTTP